MIPALIIASAGESFFVTVDLLHPLDQGDGLDLQQCKRKVVVRSVSSSSLLLLLPGLDPDSCCHPSGKLEGAERVWFGVGRTATTVTITWRNVAGIAVTPTSGLAFFSLNRVSSSAWSSVSLPLADAASKAFIVGP